MNKNTIIGHFIDEIPCIYCEFKNILKLFTLTVHFIDLIVKICDDTIYKSDQLRTYHVEMN